MGPKTAFVVFLLCLLSTLCVEAQRDGRRRSGRRKPTTESPSSVEPEGESNPQKLDAETDVIAKPASIQPLEAETNPPSEPKDSSNANAGGPPFIVPRGTRKPRPMQVRGNGESRPKPTLPTFTRKQSGRMPKLDREFIKNDENQLRSSSTSTTTAKPLRNSRRRGNSQASDKVVPNSEKTSQAGEATETSSEAAPKKRFGGSSGRRSRGGSRRITTAAPEE